MLADCKDLTAYLSAYGGYLGARATDALAPLHVPDRDPVHPGVETLKRRLFPAQADVVTATVKAWHRQKSVILAAVMGTGKTCMGIAAVHLHAGGRPYRAAVMCPDHLIAKWEREIRDTIGEAAVRNFDGWRAVLSFAQQSEPPAGPEWFIIGRDQSKFDPKWQPRFAVRRRLVTDAKSSKRMRARGATWDELTARVAVCPKCGQVVADKDGNPIPAGDIPTTSRTVCTGTVVRHRTDGDDCKETESPCGEPLWQFTRQPWRWAPAKILHKQMKGKFDYLVIDEAHEEKSPKSAQANASGKLAASAKRVVALTGTLIGGKAEHLFPLLHRLAPASLIQGGYQWGEFTKFNTVYGKIETTIRSTSGKGDSGDDQANSQSMGGSSRTTRQTRPGVMPQLFGDHMMDKVMFLGLEQVASNLPSLYEEIVPVTMDAQQAHAYRDMEDALRCAIKSMLVKGNRSLLGPMLNALLSYPDHPFDWSTVGYTTAGSYVPVVNVKNLDPGVVRPKEEALVDLVRRENRENRQVWVYLQMTDKRDVGTRLVGILKEFGIRAGYLRSEVDRRKREDWIFKNAPSLDVILSHPKLVETGLDLFAKPDRRGHVNHNFPTLIFYQTGYNLFTVRQAGRRSWRIGQPLTCKTMFMYYRDTMQESAITLMGRKMVASEAIEGKFSAEGLAAMGEECDATMALARALADQVPAQAERAWSRTLGFQEAQAAARPAPAKPAPKTEYTPEEMAVLRKLFGGIRGNAG